MIIVQEISWELTEKILFQETCASQKQILGIDKKTFFSVKKCLPIQSMISSYSENSKLP